MKPKVNEFIQALKDHADILSKYLEEHPEALDKILSQLPTHQEPKKVTVEDELSAVLTRTRTFDDGISLSHAKAAIAFMKARIPQEVDCRKEIQVWTQSGSRKEAEAYNKALADVRQALFGEA